MNQVNPTAISRRPAIGRSPSSCDQPSCDEGTARQRGDQRLESWNLEVVAREDERRGGRADDEAQAARRAARGASTGSFQECLRSPGTTAFGMNARAPLSSISVPKSRGSWLDVNRITGGDPFVASADSNPSMSGSLMSRRTTSGRRSSPPPAPKRRPLPRRRPRSLRSRAASAPSCESSDGRRRRGRSSPTTWRQTAPPGEVGLSAVLRRRRRSPRAPRRGSRGPASARPRGPGQYGSGRHVLDR